MPTRSDASPAGYADGTPERSKINCAAPVVFVLYSDSVAPI